jgi:hypothetical protein
MPAVAARHAATYRGGMGGREPKAPVYDITGARRSLSEDVAYRQRRYVISMSIRTVCFLLIIVVDGWLRWAFFAAALLLPYFAVIFANAGRERAPAAPATFVEHTAPQLPRGRGEEEADSA